MTFNMKRKAGYDPSKAKGPAEPVKLKVFLSPGKLGAVSRMAIKAIGRRNVIIADDLQKRQKVPAGPSRIPSKTKYKFLLGIEAPRLPHTNYLNDRTNE